VKYFNESKNKAECPAAMTLPPNIIGAYVVSVKLTIRDPFKAPSKIWGIQVCRESGTRPIDLDLYS